MPGRWSAMAGACPAGELQVGRWPPMAVPCPLSETRKDVGVGWRCHVLWARPWMTLASDGRAMSAGRDQGRHWRRMAVPCPLGETMEDVGLGIPPHPG